MPEDRPTDLPPRRVRALVVDDSALMRRLLTDVFNASGRIEVVGVARDGREAVAQVARLQPDVVTLDVEMPEVSGLDALPAILAVREVPVVMVSILTQEGADVTLKAVDTHLQRPRLTPFGGLYTVVDIGTNADQFVPKALKATGVLVVPGAGFGDSLKNGVRISFGPLVRDTSKIDEGLERLGKWMRS